jgi:ankyrin repeat protein
MKNEFFAAVDRGDREAVEKMVKADAELARAFDSEGATALHYATFNGHREVAELLISLGADINARDKIHNATPAGWAINYLRERGALLAIEIEDLKFAIERRDVEWVERLIARHPFLSHATDREGRPLSSYAGSDAEITRIFERYSQPT